MKLLAGSWCLFCVVKLTITECPEVFITLQAKAEGLFVLGRGLANSLLRKTGVDELIASRIMLPPASE